jgi:hypothetical protein
MKAYPERFKSLTERSVFDLEGSPAGTGQAGESGTDARE